MKREYLFRGKRMDNGEWVEGSLIDNDYILQYIDQAESWEPGTSDHKVTCRAWGVLPETVGMFSTKTDHQGNRIFAGDVLMHWYEDECEPSGYYEVRVPVTFQEGSFGWIGDNTGQFYPFTEHPLPEYAVIGNIHDNPELIQKQQL